MFALTALHAALWAPARGSAPAPAEIPRLVTDPLPATDTARDPWQDTRFEPVTRGGTLAWMGHEFSRACGQEDSGQVLASPMVLGRGLLNCGAAERRLHLLQARGEALRDTLKQYARSRAAAGATADAAWVADLASGRLDLLLSARQEHTPLASPHRGPGSPAGSRLVPVPGHGLLVDMHRTQQHNTGRLTAGAVRDLQSLLVHPRCRVLLELAGRLSGRDADRLEKALHGRITGEDLGTLPGDADALHAALVAGDEQAVVRALVPRRIRETVAASPLLPPPARIGAEPVAELFEVAADALAHEPPRGERARQLLVLLERHPVRALRQALLRGDAAALDRVMAAWALLRANEALRAALPMLGAHDVLARAVNFDEAVYAEGRKAAGEALAGRTPDHAASGRGVLPRSQADARPEGQVPAVLLALAPGGRGGARGAVLDFRTVLGELLAVYIGPYAAGAAQGMASALAAPDLGGHYGFVIDAIGAYLLEAHTGGVLHDADRARAQTTRRMIEARADADGVSFAQAERDVLEVLFNERSFGSWRDFALLERLTRALGEQRKADLLHKAAGPSAGERRVVHALGDSVYPPRGTRVEIRRRMADAFVVESATPLPRPLPAGVVPLGGRTYLVDAHKLVSASVSATEPLVQALRQATGSPSGSPAGGS